MAVKRAVSERATMSYELEAKLKICQSKNRFLETKLLNGDQKFRDENSDLTKVNMLTRTKTLFRKKDLVPTSSTESEFTKLT